MAFLQTEILWVNQLPDGSAAVVLDQPEARVNSVSAQLLLDLEHALDRIGENHFERLILRSAKPASFCQGLPFAAPELRDPAALVELARRGQLLCERLARLPIPTVALIAGPCLGAGLELALACDHRVVLDRPGVTLGFPEIELGLIPAWGGTQRLPRVIGLEQSLRLLTAGRRVGPREALACGLADRLADEIDERAPPLPARLAKRDWTRFPRRTWRQFLVETTAFGRRLILRGGGRVLRERLPDDLPAPWEALHALEFAATHETPEAGFDVERQALARLAAGSAFSHLLGWQRKRDKSRTALAALAGADRPTHVAVLGSTPTALAVLFQALTNGCQVVLRDHHEEKLGAGLFSVVQRFEHDVRKGVLAPTTVRKLLGSIRSTFSWNHFDTVDLVVDASAPSDEDEQPPLLEAATHVKPGTILASASPDVSVVDLGARLPAEMPAAGLHFVEPIERGSLVEIVAPAPEVASRLTAFVAALGQTPLSVADSSGRLVARVLLPMLNEATLLVREGLSVQRVDAALRRFGFAQGPFERLDLLGLDHAAELALALGATVLKGRIKFEESCAELGDRGWLGTAAGQGFYRYRRGRRHRVNVFAERVCREATGGEPPHQLPTLSERDGREFICNRLVPLFVFEALRCLEERVVADAATLDFALCLAGWPAHRGGPLAYAQEEADALDSIRLEFGPVYGPRYEPPPGWRALLESR